MDRSWEDCFSSLLLHEIVLLFPRASRRKGTSALHSSLHHYFTLTQQGGKRASLNQGILKNSSGRLAHSCSGPFLPSLEWALPSSPEAGTAEAWSFWTSLRFLSHWSPLPGHHIGTSFWFNAERKQGQRLNNMKQKQILNICVLK